MRQAIESHNQSKKRTLSYVAIAASIAFVLGLSLQFFNHTTINQNLGTHSLAHMAHELDHLADANEHNTLAQVNSKLARYGGQIKPQLAAVLGQPVFVNYCDFAGVISLHLIYQSPQGRMSVFVTPANSNIPFASEFADSHFVGRGLAFEQAHVSVLGEQIKAVEQFSQQIAQSIEWTI